MTVEVSLSVSETLVAMRQLLRSLYSELPHRVVAANDVVASHALVDMANLFCTQIISRFDQDGSFSDDGFPTTAAFLSVTARARKSEGHNRIRQATVLSVMERFAAAALAGKITSAHIELISTAVTQPRINLALRDEALLLGWAVRLDASAFQTIIHRWTSLCDDELSDPTTDDAQQESRRLHIRQLFNGMWNIQGLLDPETGQAVEAAIEAAIATKTCDDDERTITQRRHDALGDVARSSLTANTRPAGNGQRAQISLVLNHTDGTAHTPNQYYVSSFTRDMMMCDAVTTAVACCNGIPFDVGTPESDIPTRNRKAVITRDRCCRYPGCDRPAYWSDIHHIRERQHRGTHELSNLVLLCRFHHRWVHKQKLVLEWAPDQITLLVTTPNNKILHSPPHAASAPSMWHPPPGSDFSGENFTANNN
jgi:hypothetical protein